MNKTLEEIGTRLEYGKEYELRVMVSPHFPTEGDKIKAVYIGYKEKEDDKARGGHLFFTLNKNKELKFYLAATPERLFDPNNPVGITEFKTHTELNNEEKRYLIEINNRRLALTA